MPPPRIPSGPNEPASSLSSTTQRERRYQTTVRPDPLTWGAPSGWLANEPANGNAGTRAKRAPPDEDAAVSAQAEWPANRMTVLLIRRFRVRSPEAQLKATICYVS